MVPNAPPKTSSRCVTNCEHGLSYRETAKEQPSGLAKASKKGGGSYMGISQGGNTTIPEGEDWSLQSSGDVPPQGCLPALVTRVYEGESQPTGWVVAAREQDGAQAQSLGSRQATP